MQFKEDPIVVSSREDRTRKLKIRSSDFSAASTGNHLATNLWRASLISVNKTSSLLGAGGTDGASAFFRFREFMLFTIRKTMKARMMKLIRTVTKLPQASTGPNFVASSRAKPVGILSDRGMYKFVKSTLPITLPTKGIIRSLTTEVTIRPNAAPMITPIARSMTLPLMANSLNSFSMVIYLNR